MPEGPEIYIISRFLNKKLKGEYIEYATIHESSRYEKKDIRFKEVIDKEIKEISFKGKKIIFVFTDGSYLLSFLGLEGKWEIIDEMNDDDMRRKHLSVIMHLESGKKLCYYDSRHFGSIEYCKDYDSLQIKLKPVGISWIPSPLFPQEKVTKDLLYSYLSNKRLNKKQIIMFIVDQKYLSGLGNYMRSDILYLARISPFRLINSLTKAESDRIYDAAQIVIDRAISSGGHTLKSFINPEASSKGGYISEIYGRNISVNGKDKVISEKDSTGRTFFWCPSVQDN